MKGVNFSPGNSFSMPTKNHLILLFNYTINIIKYTATPFYPGFLGRYIDFLNADFWIHKSFLHLINKISLEETLKDG